MPKKVTAIPERYTQTHIIQHLAEETALSATAIKAIFAFLSQLAECHLMKRGSGEFRVPSLGVKLVRKLRPATKKRMGRNPATGETIMIAAKPQREVIKATVLKSLKAILP